MAWRINDSVLFQYADDFFCSFFPCHGSYSLYVFFRQGLTIFYNQSIPKYYVKKQTNFSIIFVSWGDAIMEIERLKRDTVERLRKVKKDNGLTIAQIMDMLEEKNCFISEATIKRIFSENNDPTSFKYQSTIAPLADVLLDLYSDNSGSEDVAMLKALIHDKNQLISILVMKNDEMRADFEKRIAHLQKQLETMEEHLMFREKQIDKKDEIISKLLSKVID